MESDQIEKLVSESKAHIRAGEIGEGLRKSRLAFDRNRNNPNPRWSSAALIAQADGYFRLGQYSETIALAHQADLLIESAGDQFCEDSQSVRSLIHAQVCLLLGRCDAETDDLDAAESFLHQAIAMSRVTSDDRTLMRGLHSLSAGVYMPRGQYSLSIAADEEVLSLARRKKVPDLVWAPLTTMSWVYCLCGDHDRSKSLLEELRVVAPPGTLAEGWLHCIQGWLAISSNDVPGATVNLARVRSIGELLGSPELNFFARLGMARLRRLNNQLPSAMNWAMDAADTANRIGYRHLQGMAQLEIGRCTWLSGDPEEAENHLRRAIDTLSQLKAHLERALAYLVLAALLLKQNRAEANEAVILALTIIHQSGFEFLLDQERQLTYTVAAAGLSSKDPGLADLSRRTVDSLQRIAPPSLKVKTFGGLQVWQASRKIPSKALGQRRSGELLVLLLTSPGAFLPLDEAAERFTPDHSPSAALDHLHQATSALRRVLEPDLPTRFPSRYLRVEDSCIKLLIPQSNSSDDWTDFVSFEDACGKKDWFHALELYTGDFLPELPFSTWTVPLRQHYLTLFQQILLETARCCYSNGDFHDCLTLCRRLLKIEPWQEQAVMMGMKAAVALGDLSTARRMYQSLENALQEELGVSPQFDIQQFYRSL
ncbi:MAG: bacterial transcriptional activator domain-containing protein [Anaerolineaceae bacterium]|nr:bacterial transcriptional activator domain-containing protein [Anaerolineaceae bacterium]